MLKLRLEKEKSVAEIDPKHWIFNFNYYFRISLIEHKEFPTIVTAATTPIVAAEKQQQQQDNNNSNKNNNDNNKNSNNCKK